MLKKILGLGMILIMVFSFSACTPDEEESYTLLDSSWCCPQIEPSDLYWDNIDLSGEAYDEAMNHFLTAEGKYTDDFGGAFIDGNGLYNICVVGDRRPLESDYLIYKKVENSLTLLESIYDEIGNKSLEFSVWMADVCENCNRVLVCLEDESKIPLIIEHLKTKSLSKKDTLNIYVGENQITG